MANNRREQAPKAGRKKRKKGSPLFGRCPIHLKHVTSGFAECPHGGDKRSQRRSDRRTARQDVAREIYE